MGCERTPLTRQIEICLQAEDRRIGDIGAVEEGQEVEYAEHGDDAQVDLGDQATLCGMRRALDLQVIVLDIAGVVLVPCSALLIA